MRRTRKQIVGEQAEDRAAEFLESRGLVILERNYRRRLGELDIVAREGPVLVIAEVRARSSERFGGAAASVGFHKQQRLIRAASQLLQRRPDLARMPVRFDVLCVSGAQINWIRQAFLT